MADLQRKSDLTPFEKLSRDLEKCFKNDPGRIQETMSNAFSMRQIGNETHGDLAEVAPSQFINDHLDGYTALHVGKDLFRSKRSEEDILVKSASGAEIPLSLKAYGVGPLQLSTNKTGSMFFPT